MRSCPPVGRRRLSGGPGGSSASWPPKNYEKHSFFHIFPNSLADLPVKPMKFDKCVRVCSGVFACVRMRSCVVMCVRVRSCVFVCVFACVRVRSCVFVCVRVLSCAFVRVRVRACVFV